MSIDPIFHSFSGKDIQGWLYRVEQLLAFFNYQRDQRVKMAAMYLKKRALGWYRWQVRLTKREYMTWTEFEQGLLDLYGKVEVVDYQGKLSKFKQKNSTIGEYMKKFMNLSHKVDGLSESYLTSCFIRGLNVNIQSNWSC